MAQMFETYLRTGRRAGTGPDNGMALQFRFNPNHDRDTGQFASGPGGSGPRTNAIVVTARRPAPFPPHAGEQPVDREVSAKLNRLVTDPNAIEKIDLAGASMTFRRTGPDTIEASHSEGSIGSVTMSGRFSIGTNKMEFSLGTPIKTGGKQPAGSYYFSH